MISCNDNLMRAEIYIALSFEMCIKTQLKKNTLKNYTKSNIIRQRLMLLPVDWGDNDLLFSKRLKMMNRVICFSYAKKHCEKY